MCLKNCTLSWRALSSLDLISMTSGFGAKTLGVIVFCVWKGCNLFCPERRLWQIVFSKMYAVRLAFVRTPLACSIQSACSRVMWPCQPPSVSLCLNLIWLQWLTWQIEGGGSDTLSRLGHKKLCGFFSGLLEYLKLWNPFCKSNSHAEENPG